MSPWPARIVGLLVASATCLLDQWLKYFVTGPLRVYGEGAVKHLLPFFDLRFTQNYGVSLGLFTAGSPEGRWALVAMTSAIALFVVVWMLREKRLGDTVALGLVLGGALGNINDRATYGYVIDYADLHFGQWRPFLIFNLADAAITIGVLIILARSLLSRDKRETAADPAPES